MSNDLQTLVQKDTMAEELFQQYVPGPWGRIKDCPVSSATYLFTAASEALKTLIANAQGGVFPAAPESIYLIGFLLRNKVHEWESLRVRAVDVLTEVRREAERTRSNAASLECDYAMHALNRPDAAAGRLIC